MISAGIDCGAKNTKVVILKDGKIVGDSVVLTGFDQVKAIQGCYEDALKKAGVTDAQVQAICGTGSGKNAVTMAFPKTKELINDVKAMGMGGHFFFPNARTVVDVGAEEGRTAKLDEQGNALDFSINEKCAAGAGAFIEAMARALETTLLEMGPLALKSNKEIPMNAQCAIFAESEVIGLIHARTEKQDISKAIHDAMASRIVSMVRKIGLNGDVTMMGGVAYNPAFVEAVKRQLGVDRLCIPDRPELGMAVGAAVVAGE
jgi:predicted CoA-substrate-specific enzyme activase